MLIVGEERMKVNTEGSLRDLHELAEEPEDRFPPAVVARELIPSAVVPSRSSANRSVRTAKSPLAKAAYPSLMRVTLRCSAMIFPSRWPAGKVSPRSGIPAGDCT